MIRRYALIGLILLFLISPIAGLRPAHAQTCTINITYTQGTGPATADCGVSFNVTQAQITSGSQHGLQHDILFDDCVFVTWDSGTVVAGDNSGGSPLSDFLWEGCDSEPDTYYLENSTNPGPVNSHLHEGHWADRMTSTTGTGSTPLTPAVFTFKIIAVHGVTPPEPAASKYPACPTQNDTGVLPGSWSYTPPVTADPSGIGLALNGGAIQKNFSLSRFHEYSMALSYKLSTAAPPEAFTVSFGKNFAIKLTTTDDDTESVVNIPAASYEPSTSVAGTDIYSLAIGAISPPISPRLVINYFCLTDATAAAGAGDGTGGNSIASCKDCNYESSGNLISDFFGVLKWLWCAISQLWDCTIKSVLWGIWKFIGVVITALAFARQWAGLIFSNGGDWLGAVLLILWNFISGLAVNIIQSAFNALAGVFNSLGLSGVINTVLAFLADIPRGISQFLSFIPGAISLLSTIWDFLSYWVTTIWNLISGILGAIPVVFASVVSGFNQSAASIPVYAPTCNSSNTLFFGPCLGMYIIDNTVFDGPMYYVFPLVLGFVALNTLLWSIEKLKEALSGN